MQKLSEMTTDKMMDVLAVITPEIGEITGDKELMSSFGVSKTDGESQMDFGLRRMLTVIPIVCTRHKAAVCNILAAVSGKTPVEIAEQSGIKTVKDIKELLSDEGFTGFFS